MKNIGKEELQNLKQDLENMITIVKEMSEYKNLAVKLYENNITFFKERIDRWKEYLKSNKYREIHMKWVNRRRAFYRIIKRRASKGINKWIVVKSLFRGSEIIMVGKKAGTILREIVNKKDFRVNKDFKGIRKIVFSMRDEMKKESKI